MRFDDAVVVGVAGSEPDGRTLRWAAREAEFRRRPLVVAHVWEWSSVDRAALAVPEEDRHPDSTPTPPTAVVHEAVATVRARFPGVRVSGALGYGRPAPVLKEAAEGAGLLVVGARGSGGFGGLPLGSVSAQLTAHAPVPVAVVRGSEPDGADVVVGVDGSPQSDTALWLGVGEARRTGGALIAVHAYRLPPLPATLFPNPGVDAEPHRLRAEEVLDRALEDLEGLAPDIKVVRRVIAGPPARALLEAGEGAAAIVVGSRGLGGFNGLVLGSVSQQVAGHAPCPVLVAR